MYAPEDLVAIQKKTLRTLVSGQIIAAASLASAVTVGRLSYKIFWVQILLGVVLLVPRSLLERRSWLSC